MRLFSFEKLEVWQLSAEGTSRHTAPERARFTEISFGSLMEVLNLLEIAAEIQLLPRETLNAVRPKIEEIANKLNRLRESQLSGR